MRASLLLLIFPAAQVFFSCSPEIRETEAGLLVNMDSLIQSQPKSGVAIKKTASLGDDSGNGTTELSSEWNEELAAFSRIGIMNLPVWRNAYLTSRGPDPNSNLMLKKIYATDSAAPVRQLLLAFFPDRKQIIRLEAKISEAGMFYSKKEILNMDFDPATGRLEKYSVSGTQQLAWFKPDTYQISASFSYAENP